MSTALTVKEANLSAVESALVTNDLSKLSTDQRLSYYKQLCESVGLNHLTNPFQYITLNGKLTLYARKDATEQLRKLHGVSTQILSIKIENDFCDVQIAGRDKTGREDQDFASIYVKGLQGESLANAKMKCITKAKRRITLSICGLGILDESEVETIPQTEVGPAPQPQLQNPFKDESPFEELEKTEAKPLELGDFVCVVGKKYKGKKLSEIDPFGLDSFLQWAKSEAEKKQKPLTGDWLEFSEKAEAYLCTIEVEPK